ncbi:MAG: hypothetical protein OXI81_21375 [Paracoccaceae bacterium]|nr:hypothetical protein [Paracoccaceae bacterium]MDE2912850.1 hypothetical protein [Paracoccaceae bacterium]
MAELEACQHRGAVCLRHVPFGFKSVPVDAGALSLAFENGVVPRQRIPRFAGQAADAMSRSLAFPT